MEKTFENTGVLLIVPITRHHNNKPSLLAFVGIIKVMYRGILVEGDILNIEVECAILFVCKYRGGCSQTYSGYLPYTYKISSQHCATCGSVVHYIHPTQIIGIRR